MVAVLLALGLFIVLLQLGMMTLVQRLARQIEFERSRIDALERAQTADEPAPPQEVVPPSTAVFAAPAPAPLAPTGAATAPLLALPESDAQRVDPAQLRGEMLGLMRQLVEQGLSVRDIAARCGLSEGEAELMLSLQGGEHG